MSTAETTANAACTAEATASTVCTTHTTCAARTARTTCAFTVFFDDPFWVGLIEIDSPQGYRVARHVFGAEPTEPEVLAFVQADWRRLRFTSPQPDNNNPQQPRTQADKPAVGYKRMLRIARKAMEKSPLTGTKAQAALQQQYEQSKADHQEQARLRKEEKAEAAFQLRQAKRKEKHRGH